MVTPPLQRIVCVVKLELSAEHPELADCAAAVAIGGSAHASATHIARIVAFMKCLPALD
jgi:hypothetical protein